MGVIISHKAYVADYLARGLLGEGHHNDLGLRLLEAFSEATSGGLTEDNIIEVLNEGFSGSVRQAMDTYGINIDLAK